MTEHGITRGKTKWICTCNRRFVTKAEIDKHVRESLNPNHVS